MGTSLSNRNPLRVARSLLRHLEAQGVVRTNTPPPEDYEGRKEWEVEFLTKNGRAATEKDWYDFTREPADISEIDAEPEAHRTAQAGPWSQRTHPEGFRVVPDPDQEGRWVWRYLPDGSAHACGSDISFDSESEAWIDAAREHRKCEAQAGPWSAGNRPLFNYDTDAPCGRYPHHAFQTTFTDSSCTVPIHRFCHYCQTRHIYRNGRWYEDQDLRRNLQASKSLKMPLKDLVSEHTKLVQVLKRDDPAEIAKEAKDQGAELKEYKKQARLSSPSIEKRVAIALLDHLERKGQAGPWNAEPKGDVQLKCYGKGEEVAFRYPKDIEEMCSWCGSHSHVWLHSDRGDARQVKITGKVRRWKTDPTRVEIPWKYGMYEYGVLREGDLQSLLIPVGNKYIGQAGPWNANRPKPMDGDAKHDAWIEKYRPIKNAIDQNSSFDGTMFETMGEELVFVRAQDPHKVWTLVDGEGHQIISAGFHFVNREGYFITEVPWTDESEYIDLDEGRPQCKECGEFLDDMTGKCMTEDCPVDNPNLGRQARLSNRTGQAGPWNDRPPRKKSCANCNAPIDPGTPYGREGFCCWHCYYHHKGENCPVDDCPECQDDNPEPVEGDDEEWNGNNPEPGRRAQAGPWNKENAGIRQERWVFADNELKNPKNCKSNDEFIAMVTMGDEDAARWGGETDVIIRRDGTPTNRFADGTAGVPQEIQDIAKEIECLHIPGDSWELADSWRDVICDKNGKFVRFVPE